MSIKTYSEEEMKFIKAKQKKRSKSKGKKSKKKYYKSGKRRRKLLPLEELL